MGESESNSVVFELGFCGEELKVWAFRKRSGGLGVVGIRQCWVVSEFFWRQVLWVWGLWETGGCWGGRVGNLELGLVEESWMKNSTHQERRCLVQGNLLPRLHLFAGLYPPCSAELIWYRDHSMIDHLARCANPWRKNPSIHQSINQPNFPFFLPSCGASVAIINLWRNPESLGTRPWFLD